MSLLRRQDLPPPGGYGPVPFKRVPPRVLFGPYTLFGLVTASTTIGLYVFSKIDAEIKRHGIEDRSGRMAILPLLVAEQEREFLKQFRRNRDHEAKIMADVPGWEVGKYYNEPIYKTLDADEYFPVPMGEYYMHATDKVLIDKLNYIFMF